MNFIKCRFQALTTDICRIIVLSGCKITIQPHIGMVQIVNSLWKLWNIIAKNCLIRELCILYSKQLVKEFVCLWLNYVFAQWIIKLTFSIWNNVFRSLKILVDSIRNIKVCMFIKRLRLLHPKARVINSVASRVDCKIHVS